jgi:hypothetical protein
MGGGSQEIEGMNAAGWPMDELVVGGQLTSNGKVRNGVICCKKILNDGFGPCVYRKLDSAILVVKATENWV